MIKNHRIAVIIPALNEEKAIAKVLRDMPWKILDEVFVVDNGSTDRTSEVADALGAKVVREPRRGYGRACHAGLNSIADSPPHIVVFMDGDYSDDPKQAQTLLDPILEDKFDLVIGSRIRGNREPGALPAHSVFANQIFALLLRVLYGVSLTDIGSFKAIKYSSLQSLGMTDQGYGFPVEMVIKSEKKGLRIKEVPVDFRKRIGDSKVTGNLFASVNAGLKIFFLIFKYSLKDS